MTSLVIRGDSNIDKFGGGIGIAESNDGYIDVGSFLDGLGVGAGVRHYDKTGLFEGASDVIGEIAGGETSSDGNGTGVSGKLEDSTLAVRAGGYDGDVGWVVDGCNDARCEDDFFPTMKLIFSGR